MTKVTEIYNTLEEVQQATLRNRVIHAGDEPFQTLLRTDRKWEIIWALPDDSDHSSNITIPPKRQLTERQLLDELAAERNVNIT